MLDKPKYGNVCTCVRVFSRWKLLDSHCCSIVPDPYEAPAKCLGLEGTGLCILQTPFHSGDFTEKQAQRRDLHGTGTDSQGGTESGSP